MEGRQEYQQANDAAKALRAGRILHSVLHSPIGADMAARFEKVATPGLTLDGFDGSAMLQMVPEGGNRSMSAVTEAESCILRVAQPDTARLTGLRTQSGTPLANEVPAGGLTLAPNSRVTFSIAGVRAGRTEVLLVGPDGRSRAFVTVSVKKAATHDVSIIMVADRVHSTTRDPADAVRTVSKVSDIFRAQANIGFRVFNTPLPIFLEENLGPKIFPEKDEHFIPIIKGVFARQPQLFNAKIILFCCWDVDDVQGTLKAGTFNLLNKGFVFIPDSATSSTAKGIRIIGHEMGHGLGLSHNEKEDHLMFDRTTFTDDKLSHFDIDEANQTGL